MKSDGWLTKTHPPPRKIHLQEDGGPYTGFLYKVEEEYVVVDPTERFRQVVSYG